MTFNDNHIQPFRNKLLSWYAEHSRNLPWRNSENPYHIWVSEIMLQQTRVDQARPYFERFIDAFPSVHDLANADLDRVLKNWEGLGYYSRARNLHKAAQCILQDHGGALPDTYDALIKLPGIGPYTAAAISSIAFRQPHGVLDGNVIRVLSRIVCNPDNTSSTKTRRSLQALSNRLVEPDNPGDFNQAMMELGATVCKPGKPSCLECPVSPYCCAVKTNSVELFPVVKKKPPVPHYNIATGIIKNKKGQLLIRRRPEDQMLGGMWEFPSARQENNESLVSTITRLLIENYGISVTNICPLHSLNHAYSHFKITVYAFACEPPKNEDMLLAGENDLEWVSESGLKDYALHRAHRKLIDYLIARAFTPTLFDKI